MLTQADRDGSVETLPGEAVTGGFFTTLGVEPQLGRTLLPEDGVEPPPEREGHGADTTSVDAGFFAAAGIRIVQGRGFQPTDDADAPPVAIVNQAMAGKFWSDGDPVGQWLRRDGDAPDLRIVGVASDTKSGPWVRRRGPSSTSPCPRSTARS